MNGEVGRRIEIDRTARQNADRSSGRNRSSRRLRGYPPDRSFTGEKSTVEQNIADDRSANSSFPALSVVSPE